MAIVISSVVVVVLFTIYIVNCICERCKENHIKEVQQDEFCNESLNNRSQLASVKNNSVHENEKTRRYSYNSLDEMKISNDPSKKIKQKSKLTELSDEGDLNP